MCEAEGADRRTELSWKLRSEIKADGIFRLVDGNRKRERGWREESHVQMRKVDEINNFQRHSAVIASVSRRSALLSPLCRGRTSSRLMIDGKKTT